MTKAEFKSFCDKEFKRHGFRKEKKTYYLSGTKSILCSLSFQNTNYGAMYYVNYDFYIGDFFDSKNYPTYYDSDVTGRIGVMSKTQTIKGKHFMTALIEYEEYTEEELRPFFEKAMNEEILPPVVQGKKYILDNLNKLYFLTLHQEEVMQKLQS